MLIGPQNSPLISALTANLCALQQEIMTSACAADRTEDSVTLVAVSKGHPAEAVRAAAALGLKDFGESYLQEALPKIEQLRSLNLTWHFIGRIQANKTRAIAEQFDWVHGLDRLHVAERLSTQRPHYAPPLQACIQVNIDGEAGKAGVEPQAAESLAVALQELPRLRLRGLMCILPEGRGPAADRQSFAALHALQRRINARGLALDALSMGMSGDFREAIAEGATLVRIGTALFGPRNHEPLGQKPV
ncbi:MAG TPA: YggS family pyridoxal phosphate-dependent enzyme [Steroidobacteraceae bacterium]|jgi:pyridoxal phosphate enzyme (YggS family)|nr:YggS family pyridoxal phosphate-dependent enzyme [Steroidobacteraceae bacterium]